MPDPISGWTNRGLRNAVGKLTGTIEPIGPLMIALCTKNVVPTPDTNLLSELEEVADGNGYTAGGQEVGWGHFESLTENDTLQIGEVILKNVTWEAWPGPIPYEGDAPRYAVGCALRSGNLEVWFWYDFGTDEPRDVGTTLDVVGVKITAQQPGPTVG